MFASIIIHNTARPFQQQLSSCFKFAVQATAGNNDLSNRLKQANHLNGELQRRIDELQNELQTALAENQRLAAELTRTRVVVKDLEDKIEALARENKQLSGQSEGNNGYLTPLHLLFHATTDGDSIFQHFS